MSGATVTPIPRTRPRWMCPICGSHDVQIMLPAWHTEVVPHGCTYVETDYAADIMAWACQNLDCAESGQGEPQEIDE